MPTSEEILLALTAIANDAWSLAAVWHVLLAVFLLRVGFGWRPTRRFAATLLVLPLLSVSGAAFWSGNPFNVWAFAGLSGTLAALAARLPREPVHVGWSWVALLGAVLVASGWIYPHFLRAESWLWYAYAAPLGLIPCPTLLVVTGLTLILRSLDSRAWSAVLAAAGVFYGAFGTLSLDVTIDVVLLTGAVVLLLTAPWAWRTSTRMQSGASFGFGFERGERQLADQRHARGHEGPITPEPRA